MPPCSTDVPTDGSDGPSGGRCRLRRAVPLPPAPGPPGPRTPADGRRRRRCPARRADQLLEQTRLAPAADDRLRAFSPGMNRRLALAEALLADPGTLLLDEPTHELSPKGAEWFHAVLRAFAAGGGTVLVTVRSPQEAALLADRVVTLDQGRLLADQPVAEFLRTRLQDEVSVSGPQVGRLADLLVEAGAQVRRESGTRIAVGGVSRTEIGELAYRHGVLLHELTDQVVTRPARRRSPRRRSSRHRSPWRRSPPRAGLPSAGTPSARTPSAGTPSARPPRRRPPRPRNSHRHRRRRKPCTGSPRWSRARRWWCSLRGWR
ncbi:ATP-binding cassette domain-containing protein [Streptacidiphilus sp. 4-A2]|nr:ATP-binding cassette domain-containing protein [Streptacidiphilus sp. 4-A2]